MLLITKQEAMQLQKLGHQFGSEGNLHHTCGKRRKYYLTESFRALKDINKIRSAAIVK